MNSYKPPKKGREVASKLLFSKRREKKNTSTQNNNLHNRIKKLSIFLYTFPALNIQPCKTSSSLLLLKNAYTVAITGEASKESQPGP